MSTPKESLGKVLTSPLEVPPSLLFGGPPDEDGVTPYRRAQIAAELQVQLRDLITEWRERQHESGRLRVFDSAPLPKEDRGIQYLRLSGNRHLQRFIESIPEPSDCVGWTEDDLEVGRPLSFVIVAKFRDRSSARFFRRLTPSKELRATGKVIAFLRGNRFEALEESRAILLESSFDAIEFGDYLFILRPRGFERIFDYTLSLRSHARAAIRGISAYIKPDLLDSFREHVLTRPKYLHKMAGQILLDLANVDHARLKKTVDEWGFNVVVEGVGGELTLGFANNDPEDLVRVLTEAAVVSAITNRKFIAEAKTEVGASEDAN